MDASGIDIEVSSNHENDSINDIDEEEKEDLIDQDKKQQMKVLTQFGVEFYKILTGCLLMIFVPQSCKDHNCTINDILTMDDMTYQATLYFNLFSFMIFLSLYGIELYRENTLIKYLEVNVHKPRDNDSVEKAIEHLKPHDLHRIRNNRKLYDNMGKFCTIVFTVNSILSGMSLYNRQLGSKTLTVYLTNVMFTATKLVNIQSIVYTDPNIFYSAYMTRKVQYNDIDPNVYDLDEDSIKEEKEVVEESVIESRPSVDEV